MKTAPIDASTLVDGARSDDLDRINERIRERGGELVDRHGADEFATRANRLQLR